SQIKVYSHSGNYLRSILLDEYQGSIDVLDFFNDKLFVSFNFQFGENFKYEWVFLDTLGNIVAKKERSIPIFKSNFLVGGGTFHFNDNLNFWHNFTDTVTTFSGDLTYKPAFLLAQGAFRLPKQYVDDPLKMISDFISFEQILETNRFLILRYNFYNGKNSLVLIEKDKKKSEIKEKDEDEQAASKTAKNKNEGASAHLKTAKAKEDAKKQKDDSKKQNGEEAIAANVKKGRGAVDTVEAKISVKKDAKDETDPGKSSAIGHAEKYEVRVTKKPEATEEVKIAEKAGAPDEIKATPAKAAATAEAVLNTPKISEAPKAVDAAVNKQAQPQTPAPVIEKKPEENQSVVINVVGTDPVEVPKKEAALENVTVNVSNNEEIPVEEVATDADKTTSEVDFSVKGPTENANDSKLVVEKKFGLDEAGHGVKKVGEKVIKGGTVVIEKTGQGIKKGVDKIKNIFNN
ncbi:MAG TPA: hypothetical protein PKK26_14425, partial [Candidatus Wallbacteria bacterium]|nr:hypothetical protein [Candidatus Wallbacteria bacterium]